MLSVFRECGVGKIALRCGREGRFNMNFLLIGIIPFFISFFGVYLIRCICIKYSILDQPNLRSSHQKPVALMGGLGIIVSVCISGMIFFPEFIFDYPLIIISLFCLAIVSVCDDIWTVPSLLRFIVHIGVGVSFLCPPSSLKTGPIIIINIPVIYYLSS